MEFLQQKLSILTGDSPLPFDESKRITNRSVTYPDLDKRYLAVEFLKHELESFGISVKLQKWTKALKDSITKEIFEIQFVNVVAEIPGKGKDGLVVIGAHYDAQNSLSGCWNGSTREYLVTAGADDNGSGTIGCLDLARRLHEDPLDYDVRVVFFDGEEPGHFARYLGLGSEHFCDQILIEDKNIVLAYIIDMIGGPLVDRDIGFTFGTNSVDVDAFQQACSEIKREKGYDFGITALPYRDKMNVVDLTDSAYFSDLGVPVTMLSNLAGLRRLPSFYHTENDTLDIIDWQDFLNAVDISESLLRGEWY